VTTPRDAFEESPVRLSPLVDTHAHLDDPRLAGQLAVLLGRARQAGLVGIVAVATTWESSQAVQRMAIDHADAGVVAAVGFHPNQLDEARPGDRDRLESLGNAPGVVAVGETGLDRYWNRVAFDLQRDWLDWHLDWARRIGLPVVIHCRDSAEDILDQLRGRPRPLQGVLHSFTGNLDQARAFLDLGLHLSFAGQLTFANKALEPLREAARFVPEDRLLVETDSPYLSPHPHRGRTNEPSRVVHTALTLAHLRGVDPEALAQRLTQNAQILFQRANWNPSPCPLS